MRTMVKLALFAPSLLYTVVAAISIPSADMTSYEAICHLSEDANNTLKAFMEENASVDKQCTFDNAAVRRSWSSLLGPERIAYTDAVLCLQRSPPQTPSSIAAGAQSRFDDFTVTYMQQALSTLWTGKFLAWHRYFTWVYERALRTECAYTGAQPYWDIASTGLDTDADIESSPLFDGSATSMSGNGAHEAETGDIYFQIGAYPAIALPHGTGGGCVHSGPFKNMSVNLGPIGLLLDGNKTLSVPDPFAYNPRCLKRDLSGAINRGYANASAILALLTQHPDIGGFQTAMQGVPAQGLLGIHAAAHLTIGGDPGDDIAIAPSDPIFFLLHAEIDRLWWMWQMGDVAGRLEAVAGTMTLLNEPPSAEVGLDTRIGVGYADGEGGGIEVCLAELMSTVGGPFCYRYE